MAWQLFNLSSVVFIILHIVVAQIDTYPRYHPGGQLSGGHVYVSHGLSVATPSQPCQWSRMDVNGTLSDYQYWLMNKSHLL